MCLLKLKSQLFALAVIPLLCLMAGNAGANGELTWPVESDLVYNDGDSAHIWHDSGGDVSIWNTKDFLNIAISPGADLKIEEVAIHIVADPALFAEEILDKKGKPKLKLFEYRTLYLEDYGSLASEHMEVISMDELREEANVCWGIPEKCPPNRYIVIAADLHRRSLDEFGNEIWEKLPETTYVMNPGTFDRYPGTEAMADGVYWGFYVSYPLAKVESGHFIDANVNGLSFETPTQSGITGDGGQFWFIPEERIDFAVGSLKLGNAKAARAVAPDDLFGSGLDDDRVLNVARLLQSFDADGNPAQGAINITAPVVACLNGVLGDAEMPPPEDFFADDFAVSELINATIAACDGQVTLAAVTKEEAKENLNSGMQAGNLMKRNISKTPDMASDKAKIEIVPVYVPALRADESSTTVVYHDEYGEVIEERNVAKPIVVSYLDDIEGTNSADAFVAISRDDGDTWKRRNLSKTADKSSLLGYPGVSQKPMLKVKDNMIFVAWTDKFCRGGRPGYAIEVCPDTNGDGQPDPCDICRETDEGTYCAPDYTGDDAYWKDDLFGVAGPQRSVIYEEFPEMGEIPYSCVWTSRATIDPNTGDIQWFKPERVTSGRRDAYQLFAGAGTDVAFAIVWQEDPKGLRPGEGEGPGDGWSGARSTNKTDIWYSYVTLADFGKVDYSYPGGALGNGEDIVDTDPELANRIKALVPMSLPVRISDNDVCSLENMDPAGGNGEHDYDEEGQGTHRYCGTPDGIGTAAAPGTNPLCAYTVEKTNPNGEVHHVCVTADGRFLDGNTGASRANVFLQPYKKPDGTKSAWAIVGYEESKGVGIPPDHGDEHDCDTDSEDEHDTKYKPDEGKNTIYHSFDFLNPELVSGGGILNLPETDANGNPVYVVDENGALLLDWKGDPQLAYENARRVRFVSQPKSKAGDSGTVLVALYRQGEEGKGKPADIFMRRAVSLTKGNPYAFTNFVPGAQNVSSVEPTLMWQNPFDSERPEKMLRWTWSPDNLGDSSAKYPRLDAKAQRGAINGDDLLIGFAWTPNWGRSANDKYDFYVRRSFNGGKDWKTDPNGADIEHNVVFRVPVEDYETQTITWDEDVVTTTYGPGTLEPPRNVSNLRNNRVSVLEPRLVKTPGTIKNPDGSSTGYPEDIWDSSVYQLAFGLEFNQNQLPDDVEYPKMPLDIYYSRTLDKGQRYESVVVTPQGGSGKSEEGWNPLAQDKPQQGAAQLRQTPDGSRMYGIWLEESEQGSDIMFRRVDYRGASE